MPKHTLPPAAHGSKLPVVKISPKYEGKGDTRRVIGAELIGLLPFDEVITERNMRLDLLIGDFQGLVIEFSGGDFGAVRYTGYAKGVTFPNLTAPGTSSPKS